MSSSESNRNSWHSTSTPWLCCRWSTLPVACWWCKKARGSDNLLPGDIECPPIGNIAVKEVQVILPSPHPRCAQGTDLGTGNLGNHGQRGPRLWCVRPVTAWWSSVLAACSCGAPCMAVRSDRVIVVVPFMHAATTLVKWRLRAGFLTALVVGIHCRDRL